MVREEKTDVTGVEFDGEKKELHSDCAGGQT